jgi:hypothetical protein
MANYVNLKILIDNEETAGRCNGHETRTLPLSLARSFGYGSLINLKKLKGILSHIVPGSGI